MMLFSLPLLFCLSVSTSAVVGRSLRAGTFNIKFDDAASDPLDPSTLPSGPKDGGSAAPPKASPGVQVSGNEEQAPWTERRAPLADQVLWEDLDVVGFQEALWDQYQDLRVLLGNSFDSVGVGRDDGKQEGEAVPLFWKKDSLDYVKHEHFWLSETPDVPGSVGWDASLTRMATMVQFSDKETGKTVLVVNTHFDHRGPTSRKESAKLIKSKVRQMNPEDDLAIVLGDFNSVESDGGYQTITSGVYGSSNSQRMSKRNNAQLTFIDSAKEVFLRDTRESNASGDAPPLLHQPYGENFTNPGFPGSGLEPKNIDFVFLLDNGCVASNGEGLSTEPGVWNIIRYGILPSQYDSTPWLSDHRLVVSELYTAEQ